MFTDRLEVHNNTMVKNTTYLSHTHYISILSCRCNNTTDVLMYKSIRKKVIIPAHKCI